MRKVLILTFLIILMLPLVSCKFFNKNKNDGKDNQQGGAGKSENEPVILEDTPDTGESIGGTFYLKLPVGEDCYSFKSGRRVEVTTTWFEIDAGTGSTSVQNVTTNSYSYVIAVENGIKIIKLTDEKTKKTINYTFEIGRLQRTVFECSNENCPISHSEKSNSNSTKCACGVGTLSEESRGYNFLVINGDCYYDQKYYETFK